MAKTLSDARIAKRKASTLRVSPTTAIVELELTRKTLFVDTNNEQHGEDTTIVDLMPFIKTPPTVAESDAHFAAIQAAFPDLNGKAMANRIGLAILAASLGLI